MTQQLIAGIDPAAWNKQWQKLDGGLSQNHDGLKGAVGVFRLSQKGKVVYIGCAREYNNGGLRKRLVDFVRLGDSGRKHYAGQKIYEHRETLEVEVIVTGSDYKAGCTARRLKAALLRKRKPVWNVAST